MWQLCPHPYVKTVTTKWTFGHHGHLDITDIWISLTSWVFEHCGHMDIRTSWIFVLTSAKFYPLTFETLKDAGFWGHFLLVKSPFCPYSSTKISVFPDFNRVKLEKNRNLKKKSYFNTQGTQYNNPWDLIPIANRFAYWGIFQECHWGMGAGHFRQCHIRATWAVLLLILSSSAIIATPTRPGSHLSFEYI